MICVYINTIQSRAAVAAAAASDFNERVFVFLSPGNLEENPFKKVCKLLSSNFLFFSFLHYYYSFKSNHCDDYVRYTLNQEWKTLSFL